MTTGVGDKRGLEADVCVVGAGIVGLAHALEARRRDLRVVVCERDGAAVGASVRNFGHCFVAAMGEGAELDAALAGRERWLEYGRRGAVDVREAGTLLVARAEDELELMAAVAEEPRRGARIVTAAEIAALAPLPPEGLLGGLHCSLDLRVDPRAAVAGLAGLLEDDADATLLWGAAVSEVADGVVTTSRGPVRAARTIVCPGPDITTLFAGELAGRDGLTLCKLQMQLADAPRGRSYGPTLLTGLSLLRYAGFSRRPGAAALQARLADEAPELLAAGIHLIVAQRPDGGLVIGDTHEYGTPPAPFDDTRLDELVLREARRLLGAEKLRIRQRWHGVYPTAPGEPFLVRAVGDDVVVVEVVRGIGMTTALGLAAGVIDGLDSAGTGAGAPAPARLAG